MRAALAPVIGLFGVLAAFTVGAGVELGYQRAMNDGPDVNAPNRYAAETLSTVNCFKVGRNCMGYRIVASSQDLIDGNGDPAQGSGPSQMEISTKTTTLLPADVYFVRYDLDGAIFARNLAAADLEAQAIQDGGELATAEAAFSVADGGMTANSSVIFELDQAATRYGRGSVITLDLSGTQNLGQPDNDPAVDATPGFAEIYVTKTGSITASVSIHGDLADALAGTGALHSATGSIAQIDKVVRGSITSMSDIANVSTSVEDGGPFRRFVPGGMGGKDSGVLGKTTTSVYKGAATWARGYRNAMTGAIVDDSIVASLSATVTSEAGNFAVATRDGGAIVAGKGDDFKTNRKPWMLAKEAECASGPLTLGVVGSTIETYQSAACPGGSAADCNGDPDGKDGPLAASDLTPKGIDDANIARGDAARAIGDNYFCVLVAGNADPIDEIGDPMNPAEYNLTITPVLANADNHPFKPGPTSKDVGAIDRNGTTVHLTYLTTNPFVDQRLVLVNRGADAVHFWVEDFNLEEKTSVMMNNLSLDMEREIPKNGRLVVTVSQELEFDGQDRGSATINVAAPTRDIDVMTIQRSPFTDEVDTTVYQHDDE